MGLNKANLYGRLEVAVCEGHSGGSVNRYKQGSYSDTCVLNILYCTLCTFAYVPRGLSRPSMQSSAGHEILDWVAARQSIAFHGSSRSGQDRCETDKVAWHSPLWHTIDADSPTVSHHES